MQTRLLPDIGDKGNRNPAIRVKMQLTGRVWARLDLPSLARGLRVAGEVEFPLQSTRHLLDPRFHESSKDQCFVLL